LRYAATSLAFTNSGFKSEVNHFGLGGSMLTDLEIEGGLCLGIVRLPPTALRLCKENFASIGLGALYYEHEGRLRVAGAARRCCEMPTPKHAVAVMECPIASAQIDRLWRSKKAKG